MVCGGFVSFLGVCLGVFLNKKSGVVCCLQSVMLFVNLKEKFFFNFLENLLLVASPINSERDVIL